MARRRNPWMARARWLVPLGLVVLVVLGWVLVLAARWVGRHPVPAGLVLLAAAAVAAAVVAGPLRDRRATAAASRRRTEAAVATHDSTETGFTRALAMTGTQFEGFVAGLLERDGCEDVRVSGGAGDRGADVTAIDPNGWRVVVQCKRYAPGRPVGDPDLQRFVGTAFDEHGAHTALFVTTSRFTRAAQDLARRRRVVLVDGVRLRRWIEEGPAGSPLPADPLEDVG